MSLGRASEALRLGLIKGDLEFWRISGMAASALAGLEAANEAAALTALTERLGKFVGLSCSGDVWNGIRASEAQMGEG